MSHSNTPSGEGTRAVAIIAFIAFGVALLVAGIAIFAALRREPTLPTTPEGMRDAAIAATKAPTPPSADGITMAEGFVAERVVSVPKEIGSIASLCAMPDGSLILGPQEGKLARLVPSTGDITQLDLDIGQVQGMAEVDGTLYAVVNGNAAKGQGLYRIRDGNADGTLDTVELLRAIPGDTGEHGAHGVVLGPDRKLYLTIGNHARIPEPETSRVPRVWQEDFLLPRMWDANGHAVGIMAPGGFIVRTDLDGKAWDLFSIGYRNAYDLDFNADGELFTYDSDMEWDIGAPWYRPTAVCHVTSGVDFGWRSGSACPPAWYVDVAPPVLAVGPGSPTGVVFGTKSNFPKPWRDALFCLDWTYATIHAVFLEQEGASYSARREQFFAGKGMPLTDAVISPKDGAMYVSTGGRRTDSAIYRIRAVEPSTDAPTAARTTRERNLRLELERAHHPGASDAEIKIALQGLDSDDRLVRMAARIALEHQDPKRWESLPLPSPSPRALIERSLALARTGNAEGRERIFADLLGLDWANLSLDDRRGALRTLLITMARHGAPADPRPLLGMLEGQFPSKDQRSDRLLVELLVKLDSIVVVARALQLMEATDATVEAIDPSLLARNDNYGSVILKMAADNPRQQQIAVATALRAATKGWTDGYRDRYFRWFPNAKRASGGHSFSGFLDRIRDDALANVPEQSRDRWTKIARGTEEPTADRPVAEGPGRRWTTAEVERIAGSIVTGRDFARGERMFKAASCADCHRFAGIGHAGGPDLSGVGQRFGARELAEAVIEPSAVISDQYRFEEFTLADGSTITGRVVNQTPAAITIIESLLAPESTRELPIATVASRRPSPVSPMLAGLLDSLSEAELTDLLAYLKSGGDPRDPMFKQGS
ncbi:MAG: c-type cytochrome [Phycisphaerae bacterium]|nr:c-type cytochrome [Phycisphaerae bacterium]